MDTGAGSRTTAMRRVALAFACAALLLAGADGRLRAQDFPGEFAVTPRVFLAGVSQWQPGGDHGTDFRSFGAFAELRMGPRGAPWFGSLFVDHELPGAGAVSRSTGVGAYLRRTAGRFELTTLAMHRSFDERPPAWLYGGRVRYRLAERHRLGLELKGSFGHGGSHKTLLAWYHEFADDVSLNLAAGPLSGSGPATVRMELVWQLR